MNLTDEELAQLRNAKSPAEWNTACDAIKQARGGAYPPDWYQKVLASGLTDEVSAAWGQPDAFEIKVVPLTKE